MAQTNLLGWANSVRVTMASDPGRKLFQEQVQMHGFAFLDDYLDNILSGAKQDPLIELVKTPGRKKAISLKPKLASKLAQVVTMSLEEGAEENAKENVFPVNNLTQALLNAKDHKSISVPASIPKQDLVLQLSSELHGISQGSSTGSPHSTTKSEDVIMRDRPIASIHVQPIELSVITEDDEGVEHSRSSVKPTARSLPRNEEPQDQDTPMQVDSPPQPPLHDEIPVPNPQLQSEDDIHSASTSSTNTSFHPIPLESPVANTSNDTPESETLPTVDITVPIRDPEMQPPSPKLVTHKSVLSALPTLPEPIPLRKSMRVIRDPPVGNVLHGTTTPGNAVAGKRTSWLMKAREAKAMAGVPKKSVASHPPVTTPGVAGTKRKSEERLDPADLGDEERPFKALRLEKDVATPTKAASPKLSDASSDLALTQLVERPSQDGMLDLLKKKVQGIEARNEKLGSKAHGDAAAALAEARAQAEARVAERNHEKNTEPTVPPEAIAAGTQVNQTMAGPSIEVERRFSISDLFPAEGKIKDKSRVPEESRLRANPTKSDLPNSSASTSTTPPHSPPAQISSHTLPSAPVFNKPPPVFVPPELTTRPLPTPPPFKETSFNLPPLLAFSKPASMTLGISPNLASPPNNEAGPLSAQSTMETVQSDDFFGDRGNTEAWVPSTQDTQYSTAFSSQQPMPNHENGLDDDDSWPIDEKLSQGVHWPFGGPSKEDSMTWSTLPSQSQGVDTGISKGSKDHEGERVKDAAKQAVPEVLKEDTDIDQEDYNAGADSVNLDTELEEVILSGAESAVVRSEDSHSRASLASAASSQSQVGFFGPVTKFLSSALGTSKSKPEVKKVMQKAAAAAKKQQQEDDKKVTRLKEMENRRQMAMQRKAEEEKTRHQEQERKAKEEIERRKREREEQVEKKPIRSIAASSSLKKDEEVPKKRKVEQDKLEKKLDPKKQTPLNKTGFKPTSSKQAGALSSSAAYNASQSQTVASTSTLKQSDKFSKVPTSIPTKGKAKPSPKTPAQADEEHAQPSQILQTQMAARAKAAMQTKPPVPSESIELPEVNSEYSDSEDEDRPRTFNPPEWAQSPELRQALQAQSTINPDEVFGAIRPLRMEEMFKERTSRFRARTSSANWSGADRLTVEEEKEYARRMGFK